MKYSSASNQLWTRACSHGEQEYMNTADTPGMLHMCLLVVFQVSPLGGQIGRSNTEPSVLITLLLLGLTDS